MAIRFVTRSEEPEPAKEKPAVIRKSRNTEPEQKRGRGRPASGKETVTLRLDARTVAFFKTYGDDWREAMADALDKAALR